MGYLGGGAWNRVSSRSPRNRIPRGHQTQAPAPSGESIQHRYRGGSMRIGNRLGGMLVWAWAASMGVAASARTAERVIVPLGGSLDGQTGDRYYGVYIP